MILLIAEARQGMALSHQTLPTIFWNGVIRPLTRADWASQSWLHSFPLTPIESINSPFRHWRALPHTTNTPAHPTQRELHAASTRPRRQQSNFFIQHSRNTKSLTTHTHKRQKNRNVTSAMGKDSYHTRHEPIFSQKVNRNSPMLSIDRFKCGRSRWRQFDRSWWWDTEDTALPIFWFGKTISFSVV